MSTGFFGDEWLAHPLGAREVAVGRVILGHVSVGGVRLGAAVADADRRIIGPAGGRGTASLGAGICSTVTGATQTLRPRHRQTDGSCCK